MIHVEFVDFEQGTVCCPHLMTHNYSLLANSWKHKNLNFCYLHHVISTRRLRHHPRCVLGVWSVAVTNSFTDSVVRNVRVK
jgi:hypothetical protein